MSANHQDPTKMALARRLLDHHLAGTTAMAPDIMRQTLDAYLDQDRFDHEIDRIFKHLPLAMALSLELPNPGDYRALTKMGVPVLMMRGKDGKARAFINACRHRGAPLCEDGHGGTASGKLTCPYHAWTYDTEGKLVGMFGASTFGDLDRETAGLTELFCEEHSGFIWVILTPGERHNMDDWLGDFAERLQTLELEDWYLYDQREIPGPGWKVTWDGYLEGYHQAAVHPETVGKNTIANLMTHDTYGPHQRFVFGRKSLGELADIPEEEWNPDDHIRLIHSGFPNLSISGILGGFCLVSQVYPGPGIDQTTTVQTVLTSHKPETPEDIAAADEFSELGRKAIVEEDYKLGFKIQAGLSAGGNTHFMFGRNEPTLQHFHKWVEKLSGT
ncbi:MAG: aromatic ring-hydroxylating dioxygenase subunit alpha [Alphaproteobacteria bacterium]|nr:MAG: aromatic ring-hydroxylating dioxygenase subunit alpha [Alphaproteobacteria bacterium]